MNSDKKLNLGCGYHFHIDWVNVDFTSKSKFVIEHNLLAGIPFGDNEFDVVYHSHVLEHFSKDKAADFIKECCRVLKPGGIIRIAVPDLETITKMYLEKLAKACEGDKMAQNDYDWIMLEMYDQTVRNESGGDMAKYFEQENISNLDFVIERVGSSAKEIIEAYKLRKQKELSKKNKRWKFSLKKFFKKKPSKAKAYKEIGEFRLGGQVHQWMYDRFSIKRILENNGFENIEVKNAYESNVENWQEYGLDVTDGNVRKPDSLFVEAKKITDNCL